MVEKNTEINEKINENVKENENKNVNKKEDTNVKTFLKALAVGSTVGTAFWLLMCLAHWNSDKNQIGRVTYFQKPQINVYTGKPFIKYSEVGLDITGDNKTDIHYSVRKCDEDIEIGDTVKLHTPFLLTPLREMYKMEKVR